MFAPELHFFLAYSTIQWDNMVSLVDQTSSYVVLNLSDDMSG